MTAAARSLLARKKDHQRAEAVLIALTFSKIPAMGGPMTVTAELSHVPG
jgi:hypothetical protein